MGNAVLEKPITAESYRTPMRVTQLRKYRTTAYSFALAEYYHGAGIHGLLQQVRSVPELEALQKSVIIEK